MPLEQLKQIQERMTALRQRVDTFQPPTIPVDAAEAPTPPMFEPKPPPDDLSLKAQVDKQRLLLEQTHQSQLETVNKQLEEAKKREAEYLKKEEGVMKEADPLTQPFREDIEKSERERLKVEENFFANQKLTEELDRLLTESIEMTRKLQTQKVPGLAGLQQSGRMVKAQETAQGRIAVVEAVMAARSNQIGAALNFIDRTTESIKADRQDRLGYLESLFNFYETTRTEAGAKVFNLTKDQKAIIEKQTKLVEDDLARAEKVSDMIRDLMLKDPRMAAESGIGLGDTEEEIVKKLAQWEYTEETRTVKNTASEKGMRELSSAEITNLPFDRVFTYTDSRGNEIHFEIPLDTGKWTMQKVDENLYRVNADTGEAELVVRGTPKPPKAPSSTEVKKVQVNTMFSKLDSIKGKSGYISTTNWNEAKRAWVAEGLASDDFIKQFSTFINPANISAYGNREANYLRSVGGSAEEESKLTRQSISQLYGMPDNNEKSGIFGLGKTNKQKLDDIMKSISQYQAVGYSDKDILKLMK